MAFARYSEKEILKPADYLNSIFVSSENQEKSNENEENSTDEIRESSDNMSDDSGHGLSITNSVNTQKNSQGNRRKTIRKRSFNFNLSSISWQDILH